MTQFATCLKQFWDFVPKCIPHPHVTEMAKKTDNVLLDILEKNENINTDMIDILNHIYEQYVPVVPEALGENVTERMVFEGDQLTNERAHSAQLNMANGINSSSMLMGILHRTEGLHLCMNTCLYILETFYSSTSVRDIIPFENTGGQEKYHTGHDKCGIVVEGVTVAVMMESDERYDGLHNYAVSFMKVALLLREIRDAYKMGDGNRLFRNFKFLLLYFDQSVHFKYRSWVWRMLAYDLGLLLEYERYAYGWNMSVNVVGSIHSCIANDSLVETHVHKVKEMMRAQGTNVSYEAVRQACKCLGMVQSLLDEMSSFVSGRHADYTQHKTEDVTAMSSALLNMENIQHQATAEHANFPNFPNDLLSSVDLMKFNGWLHNQKTRAARDMQF
ncbi:uncharacterized protein LOC135473320 [Liolophura sinensis]|uniref:uncharacterized protein LOC135473320 n=1 Tax=Liolophura sinensis TaxID=3198878 RepID=UPI0031584C45